jgi:hypothetical protein
VKFSLNFKTLDLTQMQLLSAANHSLAQVSVASNQSLCQSRLTIHFLQSGISLPSPQCVYWLLVYSCLKRPNGRQVALLGTGNWSNQTITRPKIRTHKEIVPEQWSCTNDIYTKNLMALPNGIVSMRKRGCVPHTPDTDLASNLSRLTHQHSNINVYWTTAVILHYKCY